MGWNKVYILIMGSIRSFDGRNCDWLSKGGVRWSIRRFRIRRWSIQRIVDFRDEVMMKPAVERWIALIALISKISGQ